MTDDHRRVQAEFLVPAEIRDALAHRCLAYLPLGTIEWHSAHLPIGLDGLSAHGLCLRAATEAGGIVLPPLYYGTGGGHSAYPWTIMIDEPAVLEHLLNRSLVKLEEFGVGTTVLFTGHFADEQLAMIDAIADRWNLGGHEMRVLAVGINRSDASIAPDHAGIFETTLLSALWPDRVQLDRLPALGDVPAGDPGGDVVGAHRHSAVHPLYGVFGPDPRAFDPDAAPELLQQLVTWLVAQTMATAPAVPTDPRARPVR